MTKYGILYGLINCLAVLHTLSTDELEVRNIAMDVKSAEIFGEDSKAGNNCFACLPVSGMIGAGINMVTVVTRES